MCCENCPHYDECLKNVKVNEDCCEECPDYYVCYGIEDGKE